MCSCLLRYGVCDLTELIEARNEINAIDREMAKLFERRMKVCARVAAYKQSAGLPIRDTERETELINRNREYINDADINSYYIRFIRGVIDLSCAYQQRIMEGLKPDGTYYSDNSEL